LSTTILGAKRWLKIGGFTLQPSELTKLTLIIYLSSWFSFKERGRFFAFLLLTSFLIALVMFQPDLGTAAMLGILSVFLYFVSGSPLIHMVFLSVTGFISGTFLIVTSSYRMKRLLTFLNSSVDPQGIGYHVNQINIALSLGGLLGTGFGNSRQKYQFLPEAHTDSIFAIIGENFGFIGALLVISAYIFLFFQIYKNIKKTKDTLGFLLSTGILFTMLVQTFINLAAIVGLTPLTGIPLPFISYGGSSLLSFYAMTGILLNIFKQNKQ
jgi:cell division protein FtsW